MAQEVFHLLYAETLSKNTPAVSEAVVILRGEKIRCGVECGEDYFQMLAVIAIAS